MFKAGVGINGIGIIGAGRLGTNLGLCFAAKGHRVVGVASRTQVSAARAASLISCPVLSPNQVAREAEVLIITTSDGAIYEVAQSLADAGAISPGQLVVHCSGCLTNRILNPALSLGAVPLGMHPLYSFSLPEQGKPLPLDNVLFALEGEDPGIERGARLVSSLGGRWFKIPSPNKPLYHTAATIASNYLVSLLDISESLMDQAGIEEEAAREGLLALMASVLQNLAQGPEQALTGPIARADQPTLRSQLQSLQHQDPTVSGIFRQLGFYTVELASRAGRITPEKAGEMKRVLEEA
jgi:predicted short-subunit dehydrogenase-like oxidoreductase (DUF2520 family)